VNMENAKVDKHIVVSEKTHYLMPKLSVPYQFVRCPCGRPAVVVWAHKGGYGLHPAYRCQGGCQGPLVRDVVAERWMAGRYDRHWHHGLDIVPVEKMAA